MTSVMSLPRGRRDLGGLFVLCAGLAAVALLVAEVHASHVGLSDVSWPLVGAGVAVTVLAQVVAASNVRAFCLRRPALSGLVLAQFGVCFARVLAPSAFGTATVIGRHLRKRGASTSQVAATLAASQASQAVTTGALVAVMSVATGRAYHVPWASLLWLAGGVAAAVVVAVLLAARSARARRLVRGARDAGRDAAAHVRRHPDRVALGVAAGVLLTFVHLAAFALIAAGAGVHLPLPVLLLIYLGAMTAGSLVPTPGGLGAVEAAITTGLVAAGAAAGPAAATALLARLVTVWSMALPGWWALRRLRRQDLV